MGGTNISVSSPFYIKYSDDTLEEAIGVILEHNILLSWNWNGLHLWDTNMESMLPAHNVYVAVFRFSFSHF